MGRHPRPLSWPEHVRFRRETLPPITWHFEEMGDGPLVLLLHGAGGATHSWRGLMPLLAERYRVVAVDLPGHGQSRRGPRRRMGLAPMAEDLSALLQHEGLRPEGIIGHSAGAALMLQLALTRTVAPAWIVGLNAALANFPGMAGWLFPMLAKGLAINPLVAPTVARLTTPSAVRSLIRSTGSTLDDVGVDHYVRTLSDLRHVDGTLTMMSEWSLDALRAALLQIETRTLLLAAEGDTAVPAGTSDAAALQMPRAEVVRLAGLGHLAHEEAPEAVMREIARWV